VNPWLWAVVYAASSLMASLVLAALGRRLEQQSHPLASTARSTQRLLLPLALLLLLARLYWPPAETPTLLKVLETIVWIAAIGIALSAITNIAFRRQPGDHQKARVPKLLIDIARLFLVLVGTCFVVAGVWDVQLGGLLTAVGVSSIVLGLALQNTLDNVMAGIAVLIERPFEVGDWIQVGSTMGQVMEMNWRSVRVRTRARDLVVVPNSVIGKETLLNYSRPTRAHAETHNLGFSYDDPPNKVKRVLLQVALTTRGVLGEPAPVVRTTGYGAYAIEYQVKYFLDEFDRVQEINDEFMTKVWYASKRNGLSIPFPTQTSYEYHLTAPPPRPTAGKAIDALQRIPVFVPLGPEDLEALSNCATREDYGRGEPIVHQGDPGEAMYVILEGTAVVSVRDDGGGEREVARLRRGEFFGEMALLTGEPRNAKVAAADDLAVLVIHKQALQGMLERRPALAQEMAEIVESRRQGLRAVQELRSAPPEQQQRVHSAAGELLTRIRKFFGL
jgi:small-conductance mechanosensitive channel/CRP-like cAMP-binding protein